MSTRSRRRQGKPEILGGSFALGTAFSGAPPHRFGGFFGQGPPLSGAASHGNVWEGCEFWYQKDFYQESTGVRGPRCENSGAG